MCPDTGNLYGVRIEIKDNKNWIATWAFPIKLEVAKREGYTANQFPRGIQYAPDYPGCPYCEKKEDLVKISAPAPKKEPCIMVGSNSSYDDLGKVLTFMNIKWKPVGNLKNCDILFLNCLGSAPDGPDLRNFVEYGTNICVRATHGKGAIFFTMFHNRNLSEAGAEFGVDIEKLKAKFRSNW
jgi:hypothetical protein